MDKKSINLISFIKSSKNREKVLFSLKDNVKIPSEISNETGLRLNYVSMILSELKEQNMVECLNEESKRGRLYQLTEEGKNAINFIE